MFRLIKLLKKQSFFAFVAIFVVLFVFQNTQFVFAASPTVVTGSASEIAKYTANLNGTISGSGGEPITEAGYNYGLTASYGSTVTAALSYSEENLITGAFGTGNGEFDLPAGMATDSAGNIYIADGTNNRIQKFNSSGVYQSQFGTAGVGNGQFDFTYDIAIDSSNNIYVADAGNNRIQKFNSSGVYQSQFGSFGTGNGQFWGISDVEVDSGGNIYVSETNNNRIQKFNSSGVYQSQFGTAGTGDGEFDSPSAIATDSLNNVYVIDYGNSRIQKFNSSGVYQSQFGTAGVGNGEFSQPNGIAIDSSDNIYVLDSISRIQKFNSNGVYQSQFYTTSGYQQTSITFDSDDNLYVGTWADGVESTVQKFSLVLALTEVSSLDCDTTYHFQAYAENADGTGLGSDNTFTTSDCEPPEVTTNSATNVSTASATLNGFDLAISNPSISNVDRSFEYGLTTSYGNTVNEGGEFVSAFAGSTYPGDIDSMDNIYSASANVVSKWNSAGVLQLQFGSTGTGDGQFNGISDIVIDSSDNIYVLDYGNDRVQKFNSAGVYQSQFGSTGTGNGQFDGPDEAVIDSSDNIYVIDYGNSRVQKFNSVGVYQSQFGSVGTGNGEFTNPAGMGIDSSGNIYVADYATGNGRIQKFTSSGVYLSDFYTGFVNYIGDEGILSITFDLDGSMYVAGGNSYDFIKLDSSGNFVTSIDFNDFNYSSTILTDSQNDIYAGNRKVNRNFSANITSLECGSTYHYRALATNADGTDYGDDMTFVTAPCSGGGGGPTPIYGCTNPVAENYNSSATVDDGSCLIFGCMDRDASNFNPTANVPIDDYCIYDPGAIPGCTDATAGNYEEDATVDDGSCLYGVFGCMDATATNYNPLAEYSSGGCLYPGGGGGDGPSDPVSGCMSSTATNFNPAASVDDGSCSFATALVFGCTNSAASNFNPAADTDDGSCDFENNTIEEIFGEVIGGASGVIREIPEEILTGVSVVGVVAPTLLLNFLQPGLLMGILSIPIRLWNLIPILMGYKRKKRPWGTVYDSVTKQPLDPVYVKLLDQMGQEKGTSITDIDGRYGFLTEAGIYTLSANKDSYAFPSVKLKGKTEDDLYNNLYFGEEITLQEKEGIIYKNIPMDALNFNWNEFAKAENKKLMKFYSKRDLFFARTANTLFIAGLISSLALFLVNNSTLNTIILSLYALILVLRVFGVKPKQAGRAYDSDGTPLSFGIIKLFSAALQKEVAHTVIGKTGRYYMLVPNGQYYMKVSRKTGEDSYQEVLTTGEFGVSGGYVNRKISI